MTKEKWLEIIKLIASFAVGVATIVLAQSCISSWNVNKNSQGATINSKQSAEQKNDSTNFKIEVEKYRDWETDRKSTRLNSSHRSLSRMPSSA